MRILTTFLRAFVRGFIKGLLLAMLDRIGRERANSGEIRD